VKTKPIPVPKSWKGLKPHPLADLVDFGAGIDLEAVAGHMQRHGYDHDEAIVLFEGQILDGRHRQAAAIMAGETPTFREFVGQNAMAYVAKKLFRQHLDTSQRAMMAAQLLKLSPLAGVQNCTLDSVADTMNVSRRSVASASKVQAEGTPALNQAVKDGTITVGDAARVAAESPDVQDEAVEAVRAGQAATVSAAASRQREPGDDDYYFDEEGNPVVVEPEPVQPSEQKNQRVQDVKDFFAGKGKDAPTMLCKDCQRKGPRSNCQACDIVRRAARGDREPGDDTEQIAEERKADRSRPKNGAEVFTLETFSKYLSLAVKELDKLAHEHGLVNHRNQPASPEHSSLLQKLREVYRETGQWHQRLKNRDQGERA
jgi:hypothetical protein